MNAETTSDAWPPDGAARPNASTTSSDGAIRLEACRGLEWILMKTRNSVYELVVLAGDVGEVMIRGGRFFPEFQRAIVVGSIFGGSGVKVRTICVGLHLELCVDGKRLVTSRVQAAWRPCFDAPDGRA